MVKKWLVYELKHKKNIIIIQIYIIEKNNLT